MGMFDTVIAECPSCGKRWEVKAHLPEFVVVELKEVK